MPNTRGSQNKNDNFSNNSNINNENNNENNNESNEQNSNQCSNNSNNSNNSNSSNNNNNNNDKNKSSDKGNGQKLTPHEILELHELLNSEIVSVKKTQLSMSMVQDEELKNFVEESLNTKKNTIQQMENFIKQNIIKQNAN